jgi:hypothetical protein
MVEVTACGRGARRTTRVVLGVPGLVLALALPIAPAGVPIAAASTPVVPSGELYQTVETKLSRSELSAFLEAPAKKAVAARAWARAIPLYQALVVARGPGSAEAKQLASTWALAGQHERAADAWRTYASAVRDEKERAFALAEAERLAAIDDPFADKLALASLVVEAKRAFALGRKAFARKHYGDALVYFHIGHALAPELPGFLRELGATYDKLGAAPQRRALYLRYLAQRPVGPLADAIRAQLESDPAARGELGTLRLSSSLPCAEMYLNHQRLPSKLPAKGLRVAPGRYKGLCFSPTHEMQLFEYATVRAGETAEMTFRWGIVENRLERPFGRIVLENPKAPGVMLDLGITATEIGVAAPADGRPLRMIVKDDTGLRVEERRVTIEPGRRLVVRW